MLLEQDKNKKSRLSSLKIKKLKVSSFIISKSKFFSLLVSVLTIAISYYFSLYYVNGDQSHYTSFYNDIKNADILTAFIMYKNYLGTSEPVYFIIVFLVSNFIDKKIFMSVINGVFMFYLSKLMISHRISKTFIFSLIFNFYILSLFLAAERLKFSLLFFVLFIYFFQNKKSRRLFLTLSILSHIQTLLLLFSGYINKLLKLVYNAFIKLKIRRSFYIIVVVILCILFFYFLHDHIVSKVNFYIRAGFDISNIFKPIVFLMFTCLIYKKDFSKLLFMFLPLILGSYFLGETRIVIFAYFLFLYLSFKRSPSINIYIIITSIYFTYKGFFFLNNIMLYGNGYP